MNSDETSRDLKAHIQACEAIRRTTILSLISLAAINAIVIVFVTAQTFVVKGRQDRVIAWIEASDEIRATDIRNNAERMSAIVAANVQREVTFGDRFKSIEQSISEIRQQIFALHEKPKIGSIYSRPSNGKQETPTGGTGIPGAEQLQ